MGSGKWKVTMNSAGAQALLCDDAVQADLDERAEAIADHANGETSADRMRNAPFAAGQGAGSPRAAAFVHVASPHGARHNSKHNTLLSSLDAGRG